MTFEEVARQHAVEERAAQGLPPMIEDPQFYQWLAALLQRAQGEDDQPTEPLVP